MFAVDYVMVGCTTNKRVAPVPRRACGPLHLDTAVGKLPPAHFIRTTDVHPLPAPAEEKCRDGSDGMLRDTSDNAFEDGQLHEAVYRPEGAKGRCHCHLLGDMREAKSCHGDDDKPASSSDANGSGPEHFVENIMQSYASHCGSVSSDESEVHPATGCYIRCLEKSAITDEDCTIIQHHMLEVFKESIWVESPESEAGDDGLPGIYFSSMSSTTSSGSGS